MMKPTTSIKEFTVNELLTELAERGVEVLYPSTDNEDLKIKVFRIFWKHISVIKLYDLLRQNVPTNKHKRHKECTQFTEDNPNIFHLECREVSCNK